MSNAGSGRLYARGAAAEGRIVALAWRGDALEIDAGNGAPWLVAAPTLAFEARGFNHSQLAVRWKAEGEDRLLMLDAAGAAAFAEHVPAPLRERLDRARGVQRRTERRFRFGLWALGFVFALPVLAVLLLLANGDPLADWVVRRIPPGVEQAIGSSVLAQAHAQGRMIDHGLAHDAVQAIGKRLARPGEVLNFYLTEQRAINAYAAPGGVVVVHTGLLRAADTAEEVAGVLAHEIAHVELRHSLRQMVKSAGLRMAVAAVIGDWGALADAGAQLAELKFSRDAEREADARGLERLRQAHIDPRGLPRFFDKLLRAEGGATLPAALSTHPATRERIATLDAAILAGRAVSSEPIALDWGAVKASLAP